MEPSNQKTMKSGITVSKIEPDILRYEIPKDLEMTLEAIKELWEFGNSTYPSGKRKILAVFNANFNPNREAADFMVSQKRAEKVCAEAFCINSAWLRFKTNFYFRIKKPTVPTKVFEDEKAAMTWLREQQS